MTRASRYGRVPDYCKRAEDELCLLVQIETRAGLDNLEAIRAHRRDRTASHRAADLAAGPRPLGETQHPEVQGAIEGAIKRIRACGKPAGILATDEAVGAPSTCNGAPPSPPWGSTR
jgi:4-hydroxy-2-oxoheptanedioate aldolase